MRPRPGQSSGSTPTSTGPYPRIAGSHPAHRHHTVHRRRLVALGSARCDGSMWSHHAARSCGPRCPRRVASACADCSVVRRSTRTLPSCSKGRGQSTRSAWGSRSRRRRSTVISSSDPFDGCLPAGSSLRGLGSATSSSARRTPTSAPATASGSSESTEGLAGRPLYFPALPPGRGRGAA